MKKILVPKEGDASFVKLEISEVNKLIGELLTIADASSPDITQQSSIKSLIKKAVWHWAEGYHLAATKEQLATIQKNALQVDYVGTFEDPRII
jgi:hypothetical protein